MNFLKPQNDWILKLIQISWLEFEFWIQEYQSKNEFPEWILERQKELRIEEVDIE